MTILAVVAGALAVRAEETVLWWQVPDDPDVTTFHQGVQKASDLGGTSARIVTSEGDYLVIPPPDMESIDIPMDGGAWYALLPASPESLSFMVELGNWETGAWVGIAQSIPYTYAQLSEHLISSWSSPDLKPGQSPWIAEGYVVPEPSSGILLLIGGGLLALRRKRRARG